ncbi:hypothetical protein [Nocardia heshunensis]
MAQSTPHRPYLAFTTQFWLLRSELASAIDAKDEDRHERLSSELTDLTTKALAGKNIREPLTDLAARLDIDLTFGTRFDPEAAALAMGGAGVAVFFKAYITALGTRLGQHSFKVIHRSENELDVCVSDDTVTVQLPLTDKDEALCQLISLDVGDHSGHTLSWNSETREWVRAEPPQPRRRFGIGKRVGK